MNKSEQRRSEAERKRLVSLMIDLETGALSALTAQTLHLLELRRHLLTNKRIRIHLLTNSIGN